MKKIPCKVFAPATVANVAVGYDVLGFAINDLGDEIIVRKGTKKGLVIKSIYGKRYSGAERSLRSKIRR